jgi:hypothetical protein
VARERVDEGVGIPEPKAWPSSSRDISEISVNSVKVDVVDPVVEGAGGAHTLLRSDCLGRPGTRLSRSSMSMPGWSQFGLYI